jgi:hypothetical protein
MTLVNRKQISIYEEAEAGLKSLVKQTAQVGAGLLGMLLLTGGNPPALTVGLSVVGGIAFVAWSEEKRLTKFYARQTQLIHNSVIASESLAERSEGKQSQIPNSSESESTKFDGRQSQLKHNPVIASETKQSQLPNSSESESLESIQNRVLPKKQSRTGRMPVPQSLSERSNNIILALVASASMLFALLASYDHFINLVSFLKAIPSATNPLTLIAFIIVALIANLLLVLKYTKGLEKSQELLFGKQPGSLQQGEFVRIVNSVLFVFLAITAMLFGLLAYDYNINLQTSGTQTGLACYGETCTGRDPKEAGCDKGADTITSTIGSFPELRKDLKSFKVEMRYSARCKASWIKAPQVIGATIYFEDKAGKRYVPLEILNDGINEAHFTDMFFRDIESRGCIEYPGKEPQCTGFVPRQSY